MKTSRVKKGSITLETALVLPIFIFFILTIAYLMSFVRSQAMVQSAITQSAMEAAKNSYGQELINGGLFSGIESLVSTVNTRTVLKDKAGEGFLSASGIQGGAAGVIALSNSISNKDQVEVTASYTYSPAFNIFGLRNIFVRQKAISRKWTGYEPGGAESQEEMVYIARTGSVYHKTPNCTHINLGIRQVEGLTLDNLRNEEGGRYYSCERCSKGLTKVGTFYITPYGDAYHKDGNCSGLKRDISIVPISQAGDRRPCSRCYG